MATITISISVSCHINIDLANLKANRLQQGITRIMHTRAWIGWNLLEKRIGVHKLDFCSTLALIKPYEPYNVRIYWCTHAVKCSVKHGVHST